MYLMSTLKTLRKKKKKMIEFRLFKLMKIIIHNLGKFKKHIYAKHLVILTRRMFRILFKLQIIRIRCVHCIKNKRKVVSIRISRLCRRLKRWFRLSGSLNLKKWCSLHGHNLSWITSELASSCGIWYWIGISRSYKLIVWR